MFPKRERGSRSQCQKLELDGVYGDARAVHILFYHGEEIVPMKYVCCQSVRLLRLATQSTSEVIQHRHTFESW